MQSQTREEHRLSRRPKNQKPDDADEDEEEVDEGPKGPRDPRVPHVTAPKIERAVLVTVIDKDTIEIVSNAVCREGRYVRVKTK